MAQGKFLRRHRIPKNDLGETYHWKDLNLACEIMFYGRVFRVVDADNWTKVCLMGHREINEHALVSYI